MSTAVAPLKADRFLRAALDYMRAWKGSYIYPHLNMVLRPE